MSNNHKDIFDRKACKLPRDTYEALEKAGIKDIENFNLKLNKFGYFDDKLQNFSLVKNDKQQTHTVKSDAPDDLINNIQNRQQKVVESLCGNDKYFSEKLTTDWRLTTGLGQESVYDTGMVLHHVYGIPYIPSSSIKGCVRSYMIQTYFSEGLEEQDLKHAEGKAIECEEFSKWFGCPESIDIYGNLYHSALNGKVYQGELIFFDAFPTINPKIVPDIMNNHYPDYYSGNQPPADWQQPRPINFLTIENTPFCFYIGIKYKNENSISSDTKIDNKTPMGLLKEALKNQGIGAKTAIGYGYFNNND